MDESLAEVFNVVFSHWRRRQNATTEVIMRVTMVAEAAALMARVLLMEYDAEGDAKQRKKPTE